MSGTLGGTYSYLVQLHSAAYNPVTVASTGALLDGVAMSYSGLTLINAGYIGVPGTAASSSYYAMPAAAIMVDSATLTNQSGATISGLGSVSKTGTYWGVGSYSDTTVTVVNAGTIAGTSYGIHLGGIGTVTNQSGGTISGNQAIRGTADAITVLNAGIITGNTTSSSGAGVLLAAGGSVTNQSGGTITGYHGIASSNDPVTVVNAGIIATYNYDLNYNTGVFLTAGGRVTNENSGAISGDLAIMGVTAALTVVNAGEIAGALRGIALHAGGSISNQSGGTISGAFAVLGYNDAVTVVNAGSITGDAAGIYLGAGGSVSNQSGGLIDGSSGTGIESDTDPSTVANAGRIAGFTTGALFDAGGSLSNQSGGTISAPHAVFINYDPLTVINAGSIAGGTFAGHLYSNSQAGVFFDAGGSITNQASAAISGYWGVAAYHDAVPVVNYGDIAGSNATSSSGAGVFLAAGGSVTNQSTATISGYKAVQAVAGTLIVVNGGTIAGSFFNNTISDTITTYSTPDHQRYTRITNAVVSSSGAGAFLGAGGNVTNLSSGAISGYRAVAGYNDAVTVLNDGTIAGSTITEIIATRTILQNITIETGTSSIRTYNSYVYINADSRDAGVFLGAGGSVANQNSGAISGYHGIAGYADATTVVNEGRIAGSNDTLGKGAGILLGAGASVINQTAGVISGFHGIELTAGGTVMNYGSVVGSNFDNNQANHRGNGIDLTGGSVTNQSGGTISGYWAVAAYTDPATVMNAGSIAASTNESYKLLGAGGRGVFLAAGGSVTNQSGATISGWDGIRQGINGTLAGVNYGDISGDSAVVNPFRKQGAGVYFYIGSFTNQSGATVSGYQAIEAAGLHNNALTVSDAIVVNAGLVAGSLVDQKFIGEYFGGGSGVYLPRGGYVTNLSGGTVIGNTAILGQRYRLHVVNAGSLIGGPATSYVDQSDGSGVSLLEGSVTNLATGFISGYWGIYNSGIGPVTVVNGGTIAGQGFIAGQGIAIYLGGGDHIYLSAILHMSYGTSVVTNQGGGTIAGSLFARREALSLVNAGRIEGGIDLAVGGSLTNQSGGTIQGAVPSYYQPLTVVNAGDIVGGTQATGDAGRSLVGITVGRGFGIVVAAGGSIVNQSGGTITGFYAVAGYNNALTVVNAGTLAGIQDAVYFSPGTESRLIVDPGAVFTGNIFGGGGIVELASAGNPGMLYGFGTSVTNFGTVQFDSGAAWTVSGNDSASGFGTIAITGFTLGDTIDLTGFVAVSDSFASNQLVLTDTSSAHATLSIEGNFASNAFHISPDNNGGTDIFTLCFLAGTRIQTPLGEVPVEHLTVGDKVLTHRGEARPIVWLGAGRVLATPARRNDATPVIIRKGALADNVPDRDLRVTKGHSIYLDDVLIPVEFLVNHRSIIWDDHAREVQLYHVELAEHDVLLANGAPAESYRDDGNRWLFRNANSGWHLPPQEPCVPVLTGGPLVDAIWARLMERAGPRRSVPLTDDPDLHLVVDGKRIDPLERNGEVRAFRLGTRPRRVRIRSHSVVPQELGLARDPRQLGVAVRRITLAQARRQRVIEAEAALLTDGYHDFEEVTGIRWTDGDAEVPMQLFAGMTGPGILIVHLGAATRYLAENDVRAVA